MNSLLAWLKSKNVTTHTVGLAIIAFAVAYDSDKSLQNYISSIFVGHEAVVTTLGKVCANIVMGVTVWRNYSHSTSPAGAVARAKSVLDSPDAPTAKAVDAATPPKGA
jgi:hypothetical protein